MREVILKVAPPVDKEDPSIIGGFSVFIDGTVYDASMRNQLDEMLKRLKD